MVRSVLCNGNENDPGRDIDDDHVFAAEGSEHAHQAEFANLDALERQFDASFARGTEFSGSDAGLGIAAN